MRPRVGFLLLLGCLVGAHAEAAVVHLRNGRTLRGVSIEECGERVRVLLPGGELTLRPDDIARIEAGAEDPRVEALEGTADELRAAFAAGDRLRVRRLLATTRHAWSAPAAPGVRVRAHLERHGPGARLRLEVSRRRAETPLLLAFPPGLLATARDGAEVALCEAQAVVLSPGEHSASLSLDAAWLTFEDPIDPGEPLALAAVPTPALLRLLVVLCSEAGASDAPAQLALWALREDVRKDDLLERAQPTLGARRLVLPLHAPPAARLLDAAGIRREGLRLFETAPLPPLPSAPPRAGASSP